MTNYDIVKKLIGEIEPVGETHTYKKRYENLQQMLLLIEPLLDDLWTLQSDNKNRPEASMKKAGEEVFRFLKRIKEDYDDIA